MPDQSWSDVLSISVAYSGLKDARTRGQAVSNAFAKTCKSMLVQVDLPLSKWFELITRASGDANFTGVVVYFHASTYQSLGLGDGSQPHMIRGPSNDKTIDEPQLWTVFVKPFLEASKLTDVLFILDISATVQLVDLDLWQRRIQSIIPKDRPCPRIHVLGLAEENSQFRTESSPVVIGRDNLALGLLPSVIEQAVSLSHEDLKEMNHIIQEKREQSDVGGGNDANAEKEKDGLVRRLLHVLRNADRSSFGLGSGYDAQESDAKSVWWLRTLDPRSSEIATSPPPEPAVLIDPGQADGTEDDEGDDVIKVHKAPSAKKSALGSPQKSPSPTAPSPQAMSVSPKSLSKRVFDVLELSLILFFAFCVGIVTADLLIGGGPTILSFLVVALSCIGSTCYGASQLFVTFCTCPCLNTDPSASSRVPNTPQSSIATSV